MTAISLPLRDKKILVLDGHDGAGKTTLAASLTHTLGATYGRPFGGAIGSLLLWSAKQGYLDFYADLARKSVEYTVTSAASPIVVLDRHWMTAFTLLPEEYWPLWNPLPPTVLCWADHPTTIHRLQDRLLEDRVLKDRQSDPSETYDHAHYLKAYWDLGQRFDCHIVRTDQLSPEQCLQDLLAWSKAALG